MYCCHNLIAQCGIWCALELSQAGSRAVAVRQEHGVGDGGVGQCYCSQQLDWLPAWLALLKCFRFGPCWWTVELMEHLIPHQRLGVESGLSVVEQPWFSGADTCGSETNAKALHNENANVLWRKRRGKKSNFSVNSLLITGNFPSLLSLSIAII